MKIILGADHGGYELKNNIALWLKENNYQFEDIGVFTPDSVDYPDIAYKVAKSVSNSEFDRGILVCGSGVGVSIVANKVKGIRAVNCHDTVTARLSRQHNNTNIITFGGRFIAKEMAYEILKVWLNTEFEGGRHTNRINKIKQIEEK
ncbi:MAG: ribose 5-phosphate isomerase B [Candidatus Sericytochromatia bacterium]|nr:MAG: ribose 5-phosphate isomerase B [Candidatus Sericytochromatia bacterium]